MEINEMERFKVEKTKIEGLYIIENLVHEDHRGHFVKTYDEVEFGQKGLPTKYFQDDQSRSKKGVLRGLHFQKEHPQGKLVRVPHGKIFDVAVDLRGDSDTYGKWVGVILSGENNKMFYIPPGFAHGLLSLEDDSIFTYKCTELYYPNDELGLPWNDEDINIDWPLDDDEIILSDKDKKWKPLKEIKFKF